VPGRGAPGTGTLAFESLFAQLAGQGYAGWTAPPTTAPRSERGAL
jgi:hydroxypyruvate isomerase